MKPRRWRRCEMEYGKDWITVWFPVPLLSFEAATERDLKFEKHKGKIVAYVLQ